MSDLIPHFPLAAYKLEFKPVDTTNCIHVDSFACMDYRLQLDYAKVRFLSPGLMFDPDVASALPRPPRRDIG